MSNIFTAATFFIRNRGNGDHLLGLLIRAHDVAEVEASCSAAFRAGVITALRHPEIAAGYLAATTEGTDHDRNTSPA